MQRIDTCEAMLKTDTWPYVTRCKNPPVNGTEGLQYVRGPDAWLTLCEQHLREGIEGGAINVES